MPGYGFQCPKCMKDVRFCHQMCDMVDEPKPGSKRAKRKDLRAILSVSKWNVTQYLSAKKLALDIDNGGLMRQTFLKWYNQETGTHMTAQELDYKGRSLSLSVKDMLTMMSE